MTNRARMTKVENGEPTCRARLFSRGRLSSCYPFFRASNVLAKDQVQCSSFEPQLCALAVSAPGTARAAIRKSVCFSRFLSCTCQMLSEFLFRNGIVGFVVISTNTLVPAPTS